MPENDKIHKQEKLKTKEFKQFSWFECGIFQSEVVSIVNGNSIFHTMSIRVERN